MLGFSREGDHQTTIRAVEKTRSRWFGKFRGLFSGATFDEEFWELVEELLVSADVGIATTSDLVSRVKRIVKYERISDPGDVLGILKKEMVGMLQGGGTSKKLTPNVVPGVLLVVGVNGVGKTTSIAKLVSVYKSQGKQVVLGAADTYRAAAIEQLQVWGSRLGVDVITHQQGADPGAVAFDTLQAAKARSADMVIIDTAGRLHTKDNLIEEIRKVQRVIVRDHPLDSLSTLLVLDATIGQNGLFQARTFVEKLDCDGVFLAKLDGTAKGGVVIAIARELNLPILYVGTGENPEDIAVFHPEQFIRALFGTR